MFCHSDLPSEAKSANELLRILENWYLQKTSSSQTLSHRLRTARNTSWARTCGLEYQLRICCLILKSFREAAAHRSHSFNHLSSRQATWQCGLLGRRIFRPRTIDRYHAHYLPCHHVSLSQVLFSVANKSAPLSRRHLSIFELPQLQLKHLFDSIPTPREVFCRST